MPRSRDYKQRTADGNTEAEQQEQGFVNEKIQEAQKTVTDATGAGIQQAQNIAAAMQNGAHNAMSTAQSFVQDGQRIASEQKAQLQDAAKKAVDTAQGYVEDVRKKADPFVESAKAKVELAKSSVDNVRHTAQTAMDNAKEQVTAARNSVTEKARPFMRIFQEFDLTNTTVFFAITRMVSIVLYVMWRLTQMISPLRHVVNLIQQKEAETAAVQNCMSMVQKVPMVGQRSVEVATTAAQTVRAQLNDQISQRNACIPKAKAA